MPDMPDPAAPTLAELNFKRLDEEALERHMYADPNGKWITLMEWMSFWQPENDELRVVAVDKVGEAQVSTVSTVWIGLNAGRFIGSAEDEEDKPRAIFETMVRPSSGPPRFYRYDTKEEALAGHRALVAELKAANL